MEKKICVGDLMSTNLIFAKKDAKFSVVRRLLRDNDIHHIPVLEDNKLVGIISSKDINEHSLMDPHKTEFENLAVLDAKVTMESMMQTSIDAVDPETPIQNAAEILYMSANHCLPVCEKDRTLIGMLTSRDFVRFVKDYIQV